MIRLSYLVVADDWSVVAGLAAALDAQTAQKQVELVVVSRRPVEPPACQVALRVVQASTHTRAGAREAGLRAAVGDIVALGETHVVPAPGWRVPSSMPTTPAPTPCFPTSRTQIPGARSAGPGS